MTFFSENIKLPNLKKKKLIYVCTFYAYWWPFFHVKLHILTKIILCLTQDKITMMLLNWRAYSISVWFAIDCAWYKITNSPSPVGFHCPNHYRTQRNTGFAQGTHRQRFNVNPSFRPWNIFTILNSLLCFCSLITASKFTFLFLKLQSLP